MTTLQKIQDIEAFDYLQMKHLQEEQVLDTDQVFVVGATSGKRQNMKMTKKTSLCEAR